MWLLRSQETSYQLQPMPVLLGVDRVGRLEWVLLFPAGHSGAGRYGPSSDLMGPLYPNFYIQLLTFLDILQPSAYKTSIDG